jgi:hypothetical protein
MQDPPHLSARFDAILKLQSIRDRMDAGSSLYEEADYAIDLALNPGRSVDEFLVRNTLRDARRILGRRQIREWSHQVPLPAAIDDDTDNGEESIGVERTTPEGAAIATQFEQYLMAKARRIHPAGPRCLAGMIRGENSRETALAVNLSSSSVKQVERKIRTAAQNLISVEAV